VRRLEGHIPVIGVIGSGAGVQASGGELPRQTNATVLQTAPLCSPSGITGSATPKRPIRRPQYAELDDLCAPRGALLYSPQSGHGLEEVSLDLMADP
jgi:hypothetical protein